MIDDREALESIASDMYANSSVDWPYDSICIELGSRRGAITLHVYPYRENDYAFMLAVKYGIAFETDLVNRCVIVNGEAHSYDGSKFGGCSDPEGVARHAIAHAAANIIKVRQHGRN